MTIAEIIVPIFCTLGGGLIVALVKNKTENKVDFLDRLEKDNERLRDRESINEKDIKDLQTKFLKLQEKLSILESSHHNLPIPQWIKSKEGVILSMNSHCHRMFIEPFGFTRLETIGLSDRDIFPPETADVIEQQDNLVKRDRKVVKGEERLLIGKEYINLLVIRYPIIQNGTLIAIGGIAYELVEKK